MAILDLLNEKQKEAVQSVDGPLLILAGPGSGKTRVITHRIAYLILELGVDANNIAAVTFTNKAAREMRERLFGKDRTGSGEALLNIYESQHNFTVSTFHSLCASILRADGSYVGLQKNFIIYDRDDQLSLVTKSMEIAGIDPKSFSNRAILDTISSAKSQLISARDYTPQGNNFIDNLVSQVYLAYQSLLDKNNAVDFDDLLLKTNILFRDNMVSLDKYQSRYKYLMIDEFQDTNVSQYLLARQIANKYRNICVVGDPDQSIYSWRNADIRNILSFQKDYPDSKLVSLNENYRSTGTIIEAAHGVISSNKQRLDRPLITTNAKGTPVFIGEAYNPEEEAQLILKEIQKLKVQEGYSFGDFAIMYRVNAQSRALEEGCLRIGVPYKLIGGLRFYQRKEIKDVIAYLRIAHNPYDDVSLLRIVNVPPRGIGQRTLDQIMVLASEMNIPIYSAMQLIESGKDVGVPQLYSNTRSSKSISRFVELVKDIIQQGQILDPEGLIGFVLDKTSYREYLTDQGEQGFDRLENIQELRTTAQKFLDIDIEDRLTEFLQGIALVTDVDSLEEGQESVALITLHQAKGLEFPVVFLAGLEDGLLPHVRSFDFDDQIEEERRLFYVGMTRAKNSLYITRSFRRGFSGNWAGNIPSRFLSDIPQELTEAFSMKKTTPNVTGTSVRSDELEDELINPIKIGQKVRHDKFGEGIVVSCIAVGNDHQVVVAFKGEGGVRKLLLGYAKLEVID